MTYREALGIVRSALHECYVTSNIGMPREVATAYAKLDTLVCENEKYAYCITDKNGKIQTTANGTWCYKDIGRVCKVVHKHNELFKESNPWKIEKYRLVHDNISIEEEYRAIDATYREGKK